MSKKKEPRRLSKKLPVLLTKEEKEKRGKELLDAMTTERDLREEKSAAVGNFNAEIRLAATHISTLAEVLRSGKEDRDVECLETFAYTEKRVVTTRTDTHEVVESRAMSLDEQQEKLPGFLTKEEARAVEDAHAAKKTAKPAPSLETGAKASAATKARLKAEAAKQLGLSREPLGATVGESVKAKRGRKP